MRDFLQNGLSLSRNLFYPFKLIKIELKLLSFFSFTMKGTIELSDPVASNDCTKSMIFSFLSSMENQKE